MTLPELCQEVAPSIKQLFGLIIFGVWEYWLGKTKKLTSASTLELLFRIAARVLTKGKSMSEVKSDEAPKAAEAAPAVAAEQPDKTIELGHVGKVVIDFHHGKASVSVSVAAPGDLGLAGQAGITCDAGQLVKALMDAIQKKLPPGASAIVEGVEVILVKAIQAIP